MHGLEFEGDGFEQFGLKFDDAVGASVEKVIVGLQFLSVRGSEVEGRTDKVAGFFGAAFDLGGEV